MLESRPRSISTHFLRQQVQLTGLSCPVFKRTANTIKNLDHLLSCQVPDGKMDPLQHLTVFSDVVLESGNHYFTSRREGSNSRDLPFNFITDFNRFLDTLCSDTYFHGHDNQVMYFEAVLIEGHLKLEHMQNLLDEAPILLLRYTWVSPTHLRVGDVVEAQMTLTCVPIKQDRFKTDIHLQLIAILDTTHTKVPQMLGFNEHN